MVADMVADMEADIEVDMVADMEVDKVAKNISFLKIDIGINIEIPFGERDDHRGWLIGHKLLTPS